MYMMKHKDEVLDIFLKWKKMVETQTGRRVKTLGQIMTVSTLQILSLKFVRMKGSSDILLFAKHHNRME